MKYVIDIEDEPLFYYDKDTHTYFPRVRKAIGFKTLVFDEDGLEKLTPLDKALEEAYQKGYDEAKLIYQNPHAESDYQKGLEYAWDAVRKIAAMPTEVSNPLFGYFGLQNILSNVAPAEAIAKLKAYEEQQKAEQEIKVGDEVTYTFKDGSEIESFVVFTIKDDGENRIYEGYQVTDGRWVGGGLDYKKTGRHFPQIAEVLETLKEGAE